MPQPFRGNRPMSAWHRLDADRRKRYYASLNRYKRYSLEVAYRLRVWKSCPHIDFWHDWASGPVRKGGQRRWRKRRNIAVERLEAHWFPF